MPPTKRKKTEHVFDSDSDEEFERHLEDLFLVPSSVQRGNTAASPRSDSSRDAPEEIKHALAGNNVSKSPSTRTDMSTAGSTTGSTAGSTTLSLSLPSLPPSTAAPDSFQNGSSSATDKGKGDYLAGTFGVSERMLRLVYDIARRQRDNPDDQSVNRLLRNSIGILKDLVQLFALDGCVVVQSSDTRDTP